MPSKKSLQATELVSAIVSSPELQKNIYEAVSTIVCDAVSEIDTSVFTETLEAALEEQARALVAPMIVKIVEENAETLVKKTVERYLKKL